MAINCWQYSRDVYVIGRSVKFKPFSETARVAVIEFISAMLVSRPAIADRCNIKVSNPVYETGATNFEPNLTKQNDYTLGKIVQIIGKSMKVQFATDAEKTLCDALIATLEPRKSLGYNGYVEDVVASSSSEEEVSSSSEEEVTSSSSEEEVSSSSSAE